MEIALIVFLCVLSSMNVCYANDLFEEDSVTNDLSSLERRVDLLQIELGQERAARRALKRKVRRLERAPKTPTVPVTWGESGQLPDNLAQEVLKVVRKELTSHLGPMKSGLQYQKHQTTGLIELCKRHINRITSRFHNVDGTIARLEGQVDDALISLNMLNNSLAVVNNTLTKHRTNCSQCKTDDPLPGTGATSSSGKQAKISPPCGHDRFTCQNGQCVPGAYVCDRERDCRDGSDEENCDRNPCKPYEYQCISGQCIYRRQRCDGLKHCEDNSDEQNCDRVVCKPSEYRCTTGKCIPVWRRCDGESYCPDRSDEENCDPGSTCPYTQYLCASRNKCIRASWQCDGFDNCGDGSDETGCGSPTITVPPPSNVEVEIGGRFTIVCEAVGGPTPIIVWRLNGGNIPQGARVRTTSTDGRGTLTITNLIESDQGTYTCQAFNKKGSVFATPDAIVITRGH